MTQLNNTVCYLPLMLGKAPLELSLFASNCSIIRQNEILIDQADPACSSGERVRSLQPVPVLHHSYLSPIHSPMLHHSWLLML